MLVPFGFLNGKQEQYPSVWVCACTKGYGKVYEKKSNSWSTVMDHLVIAHGISKDAKHPSIVSNQTAQARQHVFTVSSVFKPVIWRQNSDPLSTLPTFEDMPQTPMTETL